MKNKFYFENFFICFYFIIIFSKEISPIDLKTLSETNRNKSNKNIKYLNSYKVNIILMLILIGNKRKQ